MQKNRTIIVTEDGSKTIYFPDIEENYHSTHGALQESRHIFIQNGLEFFRNQPSVNIFEIGFGTGLNALLSVQFAVENQISMHYDSIEAFPISREEAEALNYGSLFSEKWQNLSLEIHDFPWNESIAVNEYFQLTKIFHALETWSLPTNFYDCIFFDAFSPRVQNELWTPSIFQNMFNSLKLGGLLTTYCAKGQVKRDLKSAGFDVENVPGPPGKREMTLAWKR